MSERGDERRPVEGPPGELPRDLHLWKLPRGRHGLPRELVARSQRERLLAAVIRVSAAKGYRASSVADVLGEAGVGRETFYRHFKDKADCFVAANDALVADLEKRVRGAYQVPGAWPERVRAGLVVVLDWFSASPEIARVMLIEMGAVGPVARVRFRETLARFTALLDDGADLAEGARDLPSLATLAAGAVFARVHEEVALGNGAALTALLPQLTFELLVPYLGEEAAARERESAERELAGRAGADAPQP